MLGSRSIFINVLSDDFAAVDFREDLCYHSRPKKAKLRGRIQEKCNRKRNKTGNTDKSRIPKSSARREKRLPIPSGSAGTAPPPPRFPVRFPFFLFCLWGVSLSAAARSAAALVIDKLTPNCHLLLFMSINIFWKCLSVSELLVKRPFVTKSCSVHSFKRCVMKKAITVMRLPFNMIRN